MIRNAVIHPNNDQPLIADLFALPTAADSCLVCTNLRTLSGQAPVFVDRGDGIFLFPLIHIRFVELPADALEHAATALPANAGGPRDGVEASIPEGPRRDTHPDTESELEIDEEFLRRIRDV